MRRLLNLILILNICSIAQAQISVSENLELSFSAADNDLGEVLIDGEKSGTLTITNNTVYILSVSLSSVVQLSEIPGYSDAYHPLGKCNTPYTNTGSNMAYTGFYFVHPSTDDLVASHSMDVAPGTTTIGVTFSPTAFVYDYVVDFEFVCLVPGGPTGCQFEDQIPICQDIDRNGLGSYDVIIRANYNNGENISSRKDIEIDANAVTELSTVNSITMIDKNQLVVSPNPASDMINTEKGELTIMNSNGEVVLTTISDGQVDVSFLESGFYVVSMEGKMSKLVIE